ncbi:unannotated protein [freshwater metagenome]|uniref:Unannotated protein n=1 Tax=freshwater metagenome TaxID=449393 RepID=A0A6J7BPV3_9ZZZZ
MDDVERSRVVGVDRARVRVGRHCVGDLARPAAAGVGDRERGVTEGSAGGAGDNNGVLRDLCHIDVEGG